MLEFEQNTDGSVIKEVSEATFMQDVVEASKERPVIVDFWAPWCGPCKTLGPQLEEAVKATKGAVTMAKVNVDENQMIAGQMQVQSIPTVFAFSNGQPVDGFQGAVSASEIKAFVDRVVAANGGEVESGLDSAVASAEQMLNEGDFQAAIETFSAILEEDANNLKSYIGLIKCHVALDDLDLQLVEIEDKNNQDIIGSYLINLDTDIDTELLEERMSREIVSLIQKMRKDKGYDITDRISTTISSTDDLILSAINKHKDYIMNETLSLSLNSLNEAGRESLLDFSLTVDLSKS